MGSSGRGKRLISSEQYQYNDVTFSLTGEDGENEDMFDRLVESGEFGGDTEADTENDFVTVSDEDTIDISHVSLSSSCSQKQVLKCDLPQSWENCNVLTAGDA